MNIGRILKVREKNYKKYVASNCKLSVIPGDCAIYLSHIEELELQQNRLETLPAEFERLDRLTSLNLGANRFEVLPDVLGELVTLERLHFYRNFLTSLNSNAFRNLQRLTMLNLNNNQLVELPASIGHLVSLESLSLDNNQLTSLPDSFCQLRCLQEVRISFNRLQALPYMFGNLVELRVLVLSGNRLRELPETFGNLVSLMDLDVAGNCISFFPNNFESLKLREFYCENNDLIPYEPVYSFQEPVVFSLKELSARVLLKELRKRGSDVARTILKLPKIYDLLSAAGQCAVCRQYFLHTWLECVRFIDSQESMGTLSNAGLIPIRAQVCSYICFNSRSHDLFGVARL